MRLTARILLAGAVFLLVVAALSTVIPAPTRTLLPLSVGAPELSPILLLVAGAVIILSPLAGKRMKRVLVILAVASGLGLTRPLVEAFQIGRTLDARLIEGLRLGPPTVGENTGSMREDTGSMREAPLRLWDAVRGVAITPEPLVADDVFASPGGVALTVRSYRPASGANHPIVVQIYGGAWQRGAPADDPHLARYLAAHGYLVYAVDYRHAPAWHWPAQLDDLRLAMTWIEAHASAHAGDASHIAVLGRSAGAHLALMAAYSGLSSSIRGVVSLYGPVDLLRGYDEVPRPDPIGVRATLEALMGGPPLRMEEAYRQASPITFARRPQPPTLQITGARDHVVLPVFPASLDAALRQAGNRAVLIELPWADHAFDAIPSGPSAQIAIYAIERFLAETLGKR
ncbi:MAG: alpha/beta hydrolase [Vicinamibacterales bacterium]